MLTEHFLRKVEKGLKLTDFGGVKNGEKSKIFGSRSKFSISAHFSIQKPADFHFFQGLEERIISRRGEEEEEDGFRNSATGSARAVCACYPRREVL